MSGATRPARADEIARLWPLARSAHVATSIDSLASLRDDAPWCVRVSDVGDALVLSRWRQHLDVLAIRGLWAPHDRKGDLVSDARAVARAHGFGRVVSPLLRSRDSAAYREAGMVHEMRIVAFTAASRDIARHLEDPPAGSVSWTVRSATEDDVPALGALDAECFEDFWRLGAPELQAAVATEHASVAVAGDGDIIGYAAASCSGSTVTIARLAVDRTLRRAGVGCALVAEAARWSVRQGALGVSLCTQEENEAARAFYRSVGLAEAPESYLMLTCSA